MRDLRRMLHGAELWALHSLRFLYIPKGVHNFTWFQEVEVLVGTWETGWLETTVLFKKNWGVSYNANWVWPKIH